MLPDSIVEIWLYLGDRASMGITLHRMQEVYIQLTQEVHEFMPLLDEVRVCVRGQVLEDQGIRDEHTGKKK